MHSDVEDVLREARRRAEEAEPAVSTVDARSLRGSIAEAVDRGRVPVIAEVKPTSPTTDGVSEHDPVEAARAMERGGAAGISVLTEPEYFGGSLELLRDIRSEVDLPVLRKDFVVDRRQVREVEADLVLLIEAFVDDLGALAKEVRDTGAEPLVEVHTEAELERALEVDVDFVGVNNRDLRRLEVDLSVGERLLPLVPEDRVAVGESGVETRSDVERLRSAGADALLVGSSVMGSDDVESAVRSLVEAEA
ncbi:MAG: indole-3-glycerol-phosphate synthase [Halobacteriales archaeon]